MSEALESLIEGFWTVLAAKLTTVANEISAAARAEFNMNVPIDDIASPVQCRDGVFHEGLEDICPVGADVRQDALLYIV